MKIYTQKYKKIIRTFLIKKCLKDQKPYINGRKKMTYNLNYEVTWLYNMGDL